MDLHDLHTEAQKTTTARAGQDVSLSSTLRIMSKSNSDGSNGVARISGATCDFVRLSRHLISAPRFDVLPIPSLISLSSRTMLLNDMFPRLTNLPHNITAPIQTKLKHFDIPFRSWGNIL
ncbi:hypothetical protein CR513_33376, partial [Mucuna pruriens]